MDDVIPGHVIISVLELGDTTRSRGPAHKPAQVDKCEHEQQLTPSVM